MPMMLVAGLGLRTGDGILDMFDCCLVVHLPGQSASLSLAKACTEIQMQISVRWYSFCLDRWKHRALLPLLQRPKFNLFVLELGDGVMTFELVMLQASRGYRWGTLEQKFHNTTEGKDLRSSLFRMT